MSDKDYAYKMEPQKWIEDEYNEFKKLPINDTTFRPYMMLSVAILKRFVVDLYFSYQRNDMKRVEKLNERIRKNGICELIGIDATYLDRLARTYDCRQYGKDKDDDDIKFMTQLLNERGK